MRATGSLISASLVHSENGLQECAQLCICVQRQNMSNVLVRTDHNQRAPFTVDTPLVEDISLPVARKCFLVIDESQAPFAWKQQAGEFFES